ncbi:FeoA domain protein [Candidatus Venteria ishoeyi]|uniref:FeoA domain protein n=2 Tax=Candidatus Venteria ishoeyi TaxID=1899563 RepID=A0A1H6F204_9GAMM|nr:FeoA domain protein [Candidatus Venteria ishoeyi]SEH05570.1 FeoA domain protein [Candidatus Venteria ishoeyi]
MTLDQLHKGDTATILQIDADKALKSRLNAFGMVKGASISVGAFSLAKSTMEVVINHSKIALRTSEAGKIQVSQ